MVLGKLPVPGRLAILITVGQGPIALAVGAGGGVWTFLLSSILSPLSPSLWEMARYRLKYCLKGPLNPKQPTNQRTAPDKTLYHTYGNSRTTVNRITKKHQNTEKHTEIPKSIELPKSTNMFYLFVYK